MTAFWRHGSNVLLAGGGLALIALFASRAIAFAPVSVAAVGAGALVFFVSEYTTHRFLLHARPAQHPFILGLQHRLHYDHHVDPARLDLLFLPPWFVIPVAALTFGLYLAATRSVALAAAMLLGSVLGLLWYEWVHYVAHVPFVPKTPFGRWMKKYHLRHHFKNERLGFGVTNPAIDVVLRTFARAGDAERSGTTRVLYPR